MRTVSSYSLRDNLSTYLSEIEKSEIPVVISRFGKPVAVISPYKKGILPSRKSYFGFLGKGSSGEKFLAKTRRSDKEKKLITKLRSR